MRQHAALVAAGRKKKRTDSREEGDGGH